MPDGNDSIQISDMADTVIARTTVTIAQDGADQTGAAAYMPAAGDVVGVTFVNDSTAAYGGVTGSLLKTGVNTIKESANNLADHTPEHFASAALANNTGLAKGADLTLTTGAGGGAGPSLCIIEIEYKLNAVA